MLLRSAAESLLINLYLIIIWLSLEHLLVSLWITRKLVCIDVLCVARSCFCLTPSLIQGLVGLHSGTHLQMGLSEKLQILHILWQELKSLVLMWVESFQLIFLSEWHSIVKAAHRNLKPWTWQDLGKFLLVAVRSC